jgi:uncharacterized membrane protein (UPF0127 family)
MAADDVKLVIPARGSGGTGAAGLDWRGCGGGAIVTRIGAGFRRRHLLAVMAAGALAPAIAVAAQALDAGSGPQPELPKEALVIVTHDGKRHLFHVEMALTPEQQTIGLMNRPVVPADGGMLFDWGAPRESQMWMRNTVASLDMLFINADGTIRSIAEHTVPHSLAIIDSRGPVRATLELAAGTAERLDIRVGDMVRQRIFGTAAK